MSKFVIMDALSGTLLCIITNEDVRFIPNLVRITSRFELLKLADSFDLSIFDSTKATDWRFVKHTGDIIKKTNVSEIYNTWAGICTSALATLETIRLMQLALNEPTDAQLIEIEMIRETQLSNLVKGVVW